MKPKFSLFCLLMFVLAINVFLLRVSDRSRLKRQQEQREQNEIEVRINVDERMIKHMKTPD